MKSGSLNLLEPSGPVQACTGIALPMDYIEELQSYAELEISQVAKENVYMF